MLGGMSSVGAMHAGGSGMNGNQLSAKCHGFGPIIVINTYVAIKIRKRTVVPFYIFSIGSRRERKRLKQQAVNAEQAALASGGLGGIASPGSSLSRDERKGKKISSFYIQYHTQFNKTLKT